jgi:hypothetical protein
VTTRELVRVPELFLDVGPVELIRRP